jgi:hypothetical protein
MKREFHQIATTKSELFVRCFACIARTGRDTREPEIDDAWVMQVIQEAQEEQRRNPMTIEELLRESRALAEYGARLEEVINRIVHEKRARWREKNRA